MPPDIYIYAAIAVAIYLIAGIARRTLNRTAPDDPVLDEEVNDHRAHRSRDPHHQCQAVAPGIRSP